jgi:hypothetical protein
MYNIFNRTDVRFYDYLFEYLLSQLIYKGYAYGYF